LAYSTERNLPVTATAGDERIQSVSHALGRRLQLSNNMLTVID